MGKKSVADPVTGYAKAVLKGNIIAGPYVRLACQRHLDDLKHGKARGLKWDLPKALRAIGFFHDVLTLAEGEHAGQPFISQPSKGFRQICQKFRDDRFSMNFERAGLSRVILTEGRTAEVVRTKRGVGGILYVYQLVIPSHRQ